MIKHFDKKVPKEIVALKKLNLVYTSLYLNELNITLSDLQTIDLRMNTRQNILLTFIIMK